MAHILSRRSLLCIMRGDTLTIAFTGDRLCGTVMWPNALLDASAMIDIACADFIRAIYTCRTRCNVCGVLPSARFSHSLSCALEAIVVHIVLIQFFNATV